MVTDTPVGELASGDLLGVWMQTLVGRLAVTYAVHRGAAMLWRKEVRFGSQPSHRAGGLAFQLAAREQEARAWREHLGDVEHNAPTRAARQVDGIVDVVRRVG